MKTPINPALPTATEDADDPDAAASQSLTRDFAGCTIRRIAVCSGDGEHAAHVNMTLTNGTILYVLNNGDSFIVGRADEIDDAPGHMPAAAGVH